MSARFEVRPSAMINGRFVVIDVERDMVARHGGKTVALAVDRATAERACARLTTAAGAVKICKGCRHKRPALDFEGGNCADCHRAAACARPARRRPRKGRR